MSEHIKRKPKPSLQIIFNHLQWQKNTSVNNEQQLSPEKQTAPNCPQTTSLSEPPSPEEETVVKEPEIKQNDVRIPPITSRIKQKKSHPRVNAPTTQVEILNEHSVESTIKTSHKPKETSSPPQSVQTKKLARKKLPKNSTKPHTSVNAQTTQEELLTERSAESAMKTLQNSEETSLPAKKLEKQKVINNSTPTRSREKQRHPRISAPMTQENLNQCSLESTINTPQKLREPLPPHSFPTKTPRKQRVLKSSIYISPFFTKAYAFSNHFKCYFYVDDLRFCCTEQFYMYYKAVVFGDTESANQIMEMTEARDMKRVGSYIRLFDTEKWRKISILVMTICNMEKYKQNKDLRRLLFETGDTILVEATSQDLYWGAGIDADSAAIRDKDNWPGKNVLGRILTRIRDVLKSRKEYLHEWEEANRRLTI